MSISGSVESQRSRSGTSPLQQIKEAVGAHACFALFSHEEPDGDAIGSQVALALALRRLGKHVISVRLDGVPPALSFLNGECAIERYAPERHTESIFGAGVIFLLDSSAPSRLGEMAALVERSTALTINIDHHRDNTFFGDINFIRFGAGGTAELVFEVVQAIGAPIEGAIAEAIYVGICTDTLGFKYIDPEGNMIGIVAELVRGGIDVEKLQERLYYLRPDSYLEDMAGLMKNVVYEDGGGIAWFAIPKSAHLTYYQRELASETLHQLLSMEKIKVVVMLHEGKSGVEVWLRSKTDVDVGKVAQALGGGGHRTASGVLIKGMSVNKAVRAILTQVRASTAVKGEK
jgi:phosphoesterase RecJ-like protein